MVPDNYALLGAINSLNVLLPNRPLFLLLDTPQNSIVTVFVVMLTSIIGGMFAVGYCGKWTFSCVKNALN